MNSFRRKPSSAKHKKWDGDAFMLQTRDKLKLISEVGKMLVDALFKIFFKIHEKFRLGTAPWDGRPLHSGYAIRMAGRDVELDSQITATQMPNIIGSTEQPDADEEMISEPSQLAGPSFLKQALRKESVQEEPTSAPKFVAPTSFYGASAPKAKQKGPLFVVITSPLIKFLRFPA